MDCEILDLGVGVGDWVGVGPSSVRYCLVTRMSCILDGMVQLTK